MERNGFFDVWKNIVMIQNLRKNLKGKYIFEAKFSRMVISQKFIIESYDKSCNQLTIRSKTRYCYLSLNTGIVVMVCQERNVSLDLLKTNSSNGTAKICKADEQDLNILKNISFDTLTNEV